MTFRVGQKVVCINDLATGKRWLGDLPIAGEIYTITRIFVCGDGEFKGRTALTFKEIDAGYLLKNGAPCGYNPARFRPVVETDISFAHEIVRKVFEGVRA